MSDPRADEEAQRAAARLERHVSRDYWRPGDFEGNWDEREELEADS